MCIFVHSKDKATDATAPFQFIMIMDPFLRLKKRMGEGDTLILSLEGLSAIPKEEDEEEEKESVRVSTQKLRSKKRAQKTQPWFHLKKFTQQT